MRPALKVVNPETGELHEDCPQCSEYADQVKGLERDLRAWRSRYAEIARDRDREAQLHDLWPEAERLFGYWKLRCRHPRSRFTVDRFEVARPLLEKYGPETCKRAIDGAAFDPFVTTLKNGRKQRHDSWGLVFRDADKLESFVNRAPVTA